ncbi:MAG: hypothetical protein ACM3U1_11355 [Chloroflexota bacterium]
MKKEVFSSHIREVDVKSVITQLAKATLTFIAFIAITTIAESQNFTNSGANASYQSCATGNGGIIKMRSSAGVFDGTNELGTVGSRIAGTVEWAGTVGAQTIEPNYYTNLTTSGGATKNFTAGQSYYVSGEYLPADGTRNYTTSNFYYDGTDPQTLFAESAAGNTYYNVFLTNGGAKTHIAGQTFIVTNTLDHSAAGGFTAIGGVTTGNLTSTAAITVNGDGTNVFSIVSDANASTVQGVFTVTAGELSLDGNAPVTVSGAGALALANSASAKLDLTDGAQLDIATTFTNGFDARTNMTFHDLSTVTYSGNAQSVVSTVATNPYGNLALTGGGAKTVAAGGANDDIFMTNNFTLSAGTLSLAGAVGGTSKLSMTDGTVTYGSANNDVFVQGNMERTGNLATGVNYTMNNAQTQVNFQTAGAGLTSFAMDVIPGVRSTQYGDDDNTIDLNRQVRLTFGGTGEIDVLRVGYVAGDVPGGANEDVIRLFEAYDATGAADKQKIILPGLTGYVTRSGASDARFVQLDGDATHTLSLIAGVGGGAGDEMTTSSDIVLSADARIRTIADGRWSNPAIWDEGAVPLPTDEAYVRNFVYAGIEGNAFGITGYAGNERFGAGDANAVAKSITIDAPTGSYPHPALIVGYDDADLPANFSFRTVLNPATAGGGLFNTNTTASTFGGVFDKTYDHTAGTVMGVYIMSPNGGNIPSLEASQVTNNGTFKNCGILGIGQ